MNDLSKKIEFDVVEALSVEAYLDLIDYSRDPHYIPSAFAVSFVNFIKLVNGVEGEENKTPLIHYYMLDTITDGGNRVVNMCHRGVAKTTLMGEYLFLYLAVYHFLPGFGNVSIALYVSDSIENGVKNMRKNLEHRYENSDFLQQYLPRKTKEGKDGVRFTDVRWEFTNADGEKLIVKAYGAKTGVRGAKEMGKRPQLAILDDLISDEDARSATVIASVEDTIYKAVTYALHPKQNMIIWSGTPFNSNDPLYKAVSSGAWKVNVFPICEKFPCTEAEFKGSWPDRFPYSYVKKEYERMLKLGMVNMFNQELMLRIMSDEERLIKDYDILWYSIHSLLNNIGSYNFYITTDFATSEKEASDYTVISVWAYSSAGQWFWVDGVCERCDMGKGLDHLFTLAQQYKPDLVGIEVSGQQQGFVPWIMKEQMERNIFFQLASDKNGGQPGIRPNTNKLERFNIIQPWFAAHRMYFPIEKKGEFSMVEAMDELRLASRTGFRSKNDDWIDAMTMLSCIDAWKPSEQSEAMSLNSDAIWEEERKENEPTAFDSYIY